MKGPPPEFSPLKLSAKSLKVTRPTLFSQIATVEEFVQAAEMVFDTYKRGALKVRHLQRYRLSYADISLGHDPQGVRLFRGGCGAGSEGYHLEIDHWKVGHQDRVKRLGSI